MLLAIRLGMFLILRMEYVWTILEDSEVLFGLRLTMTQRWFKKGPCKDPEACIQDPGYNVSGSRHGLG